MVRILSLHLESRLGGILKGNSNWLLSPTSMFPTLLASQVDQIHLKLVSTRERPKYTFPLHRFTHWSIEKKEGDSEYFLQSPEISVRDVTKDGMVYSHLDLLRRNEFQYLGILQRMVKDLENFPTIETRYSCDQTLIFKMLECDPWLSTFSRVEQVPALWDRWFYSTEGLTSLREQAEASKLSLREALPYQFQTSPDHLPYQVIFQFWEEEDQLHLGLQVSETSLKYAEVPDLMSAGSLMLNNLAHTLKMSPGNLLLNFEEVTLDRSELDWAYHLLDQTRLHPRPASSEPEFRGDYSLGFF